MSHKYAYSRKSLATNMRKQYHNSSHLRSERNLRVQMEKLHAWGGSGRGGSRGGVGGSRGGVEGLHICYLVVFASC